MKTLIIYNEIERVRFAILDGDYSRFNGIAINGHETDYDQEFTDLVYDEKGFEKVKFSDDISLIENKQWDKVAIVTCLP